MFRCAFEQRIPVLLKGPTGCGKTRFLEHMASRLGTPTSGIATAAGAAATATASEPYPLVTVACHEDLTTSDLVGRYLLDTNGTHWIDGPLTRAVRDGGICYLDEVVEARNDVTVIIHALTDHRRMLPIEKLGSSITAHPDFHLVISYNPGYQSSLKDLKHSTRQRFVAIPFSYPPAHIEARIVAHETGVDEALAQRLAFLASKLRNLPPETAAEGPSTRLLIHTARLVRSGLELRRAADVAIVEAVTDDPVVQEGLRDVVTAVLG